MVEVTNGRPQLSLPHSTIKPNVNLRYHPLAEMGYGIVNFVANTIRVYRKALNREYFVY